MSTTTPTFPVKDVLSRYAFNHLWELGGDYGNVHRTSHSELVAGEHAPGDIKNAIDEHSFDLIETAVAKAVVIDCFSGENNTHRGDYDISHCLATPRSVTFLSAAFREAAAVGSGIMIPVGELLSRALVTNPAARIHFGADLEYSHDDLSQEMKIEDLFMNPSNVTAFADGAYTRPFLNRDIVIRQARAMQNGLLRVLFGTNTTDPRKQKIDVNREYPHMTAPVLSQMIGMTKGNPCDPEQSERVLRFLTAAAHHPNFAALMETPCVAQARAAAREEWADKRRLAERRIRALDVLKNAR